MQQCYVDAFLKPFALETFSLGQGAFRRDRIVGCNLLFDYFLMTVFKAQKKKKVRQKKMIMKKVKNVSMEMMLKQKTM